MQQAATDAASNDEEEDYMSERFLVEKKEDIKLPSLSLKRRLEQEKEHELRSKMKNHKAMEDEIRKEGMAKEIDEKNKGFQLLQKMGFKKGTGLGRDGSGIIAPISVTLKSNRTGLGLDQERQRIEAAKRAFVAQAERARVADFKDRMAQKFQDRVFRVQLQKCRAAAHQLDSSRGKHDGPYAISEDAPELVDEEDEDEQPVWPRLEAVIMYLRKEHRYCFYCGHTFSSDEELAKKCPGPFEADHDS